MQAERFAGELDGASGIDLDPRKLLLGTERAELDGETLLRDIAAGCLDDADRVVQDQRAERERAASAFEDDPQRARSAAVDPGDPRADGTLGKARGGHRARRRRSRRRGDASL